jgi:hypothetical protein
VPTRIVVLAALAAVLGWCAPAGAQEWAGTQLEPGQAVVDLDMASSAIGSTVVVYNVSRSPRRPEMRAAVRGFGGALSEPQVLDADSFFPTVAGSAAGGAVAAWYAEPSREILIAELAPGESRFAEPHAAPGTGGNYSYGWPEVAVGESGDAIVVYLANHPEGQRLMSRHRPAGGTFGEPEPLTPVTARDQVYARDVAVGPDGTVYIADPGLKGVVALTIGRPP